MELLELRHKILELSGIDEAEKQKLFSLLEQDKSIFPFNEYEYMLHYLIDNKSLTFSEYSDIRQDYINKNPNLWVFEISAPRGFGEKFAETYLMGICAKLSKPSKKIDPNYSGQYDLVLDNIKIEVKASRAVDLESTDPLYVKALSSTTKQKFLMNFQQLKPDCCDVFIWLAVFRDVIKIWVISSENIVNHPLYSNGQHRGNYNNEGQLHIKQDNIHLFDNYLLGQENLEQSIRKANQNNK